MSMSSLDRSGPSRARPSTSKRLGLGFVVLLLAQLVIGLLGLQALNRFRLDLDRAETVRQTRLAAAQELHDGISQIGLHTRTLVVLSNPAQLAQEARLLAQAQARVQQIERTLGEADWAPSQRVLVDATASAGAAARPLIDAAARMGHDGQNRDAVQELLQQVRPVEATWRQQAQRLNAALVDEGRLAIQEVRANQERALWLLGSVTLGCLLVGAAIAWVLVRSIRQPVDQAVRVAEGPARPANTDQADAPAQADEPERLQRAMSDIQKRLRDGAVHAAAARRADVTVPPTARAATPVPPFGAPPEPSSVASMPAARPFEDYVPPQPAPSSVDRANAFRAAVAQPVSSQSVVSNAVRVAERGSEVVTQVVSNLEDISASSRKINEILATIDGIAFQTNILALNAAVQAARAGQENQGFGVVAGEVRALAQRAASAAREIKGLIHASVEKAESGTRLVRDAGATMDAIVSSVQSVTELVGQITGKAGEPSPDNSIRLAEADLSVQRLDHLTQQNAALVEQSASAADALRQQAERLQKVVGAFRLLQQTQEAAWTAHTAIHSARATSRGDTQPGGLDQLGAPGSPNRAGKGAPPAGPGGELGGGWSNF